jgi:uncharacterized protein
MSQLGQLTLDFAVLLVEMLLLLIAVAAGLALFARRAGLERLQRWLGGGALLGAVFVTPFCTYSAIPVVFAMADARVRAATMTGFLLSSPLLDPVVAGVLVLLFGWQATMAYVVITFFAVLGASLLADVVQADRHLRPALARSSGVAPAGSRARKQSEPANCDVPSTDLFGDRTTPWRGWSAEARAAFAYAIDLARGLALPLVAAVMVAVLIVGFVPTSLVSDLAGPDNPLAVPVAALLGAPFYVSTEAFLPVAAGLHQAGMGVGAVFALVISAAGVNVPELGLLSTLMPIRLLAGYTAAVLAIAVSVGYLVPVFA